MDNDYLTQQLAEIDEKIEEANQLLDDPILGGLAKADIEELQQQKAELQDSASTPMASQDDSSETEGLEVNPNVAILEIRSAAGGDEAGLFASDLLRMYLRYAESKNWQVEIIDSSEGGIGQIKQAVIKIMGKDAYFSLRFESGVHRVQRVPKTESSGRIHTSTATVAILPEIPPTQISLNPSDITFESFRSGGHGGQNVNKVSTAVRIKHIPTGVVVKSQTERSQAQNREIAMEILRSKIYQLEEEQRQSTIHDERSTQVGAGDRSEKIRTYNFPQSRLTDHRINKSWHDLENILEGNLDKVIKALN